MTDGAKKKRRPTENPRCGDYGHFVTRDGKKVPCRAMPIRGGTVCRRHGGASPHVKRAAARRLWDATLRVVDPDGVLRTLAEIAGADITEMFDAQGKLLNPKAWPEGIRQAVAGIEVTKRNVVAGDGILDDVVKVKLWPKVQALELLAKHLGLASEKVQHTGALSISWADPAGGDDEEGDA